MASLASGSGDRAPAPAVAAAVVGAAAATKLSQDGEVEEFPPVPPAQEQRRRTGGGGKQRKERKGLCFALGAETQSQVSEFDLGHKVDGECKRFLDRIYYQARLHGQLDCFKRKRGS